MLGNRWGHSVYIKDFNDCQIYSGILYLHVPGSPKPVYFFRPDDAQLSGLSDIPSLVCAGPLFTPKEIQTSWNGQLRQMRRGSKDMETKYQSL